MNKIIISALLFLFFILVYSMVNWADFHVGAILVYGFMLFHLEFQSNNNNNHNNNNNNNNIYEWRLTISYAKVHNAQKSASEEMHLYELTPTWNRTPS